MHLEGMIEQDWRCTSSWSIWRWYIRNKARTEAETLFIGQHQDRWEGRVFGTTRCTDRLEMTEWLGAGET